MRADDVRARFKKNKIKILCLLFVFAFLFFGVCLTLQRCVIYSLSPSLKLCSQNYVKITHTHTEKRSQKLLNVTWGTESRGGNTACRAYPHTHAQAKKICHEKRAKAAAAAAPARRHRHRQRDNYALLLLLPLPLRRCQRQAVANYFDDVD